MATGWDMDKFAMEGVDVGIFDHLGVGPLPTFLFFPGLGLVKLKCNADFDPVTA